MTGVQTCALPIYNYDGGEICFYNKNDSKIYQYKPSPGDITVFPSGKPFYHGVNKISKNNRYHLRNFIYCVDNDKNILDKYKDSKNTIDIYYPEEDVNLEKIDKEYSVFLKEKPIIVK